MQEEELFILLRTRTYGINVRFLGKDLENLQQNLGSNISTYSIRRHFYCATSFVLFFISVCLSVCLELRVQSCIGLTFSVVTIHATQYYSR